MVAAAQIPTVLVVDDEEALRSYMIRVLQDDGYSVIDAANGLEALLLLEGGHAGTVDLVVTDVLMPRMSGTDLAARLAGRPSSPPVLFVSGSHGLSDVPGPLLRKPFLPADLSALARDLLVLKPAPEPLRL